MRRNYLDIYYDILNVSKDGARKTRIVYNANLNFKILKKYLRTLLDKGLIYHLDSHYFTTQQGLSFLNSYKKMNGVASLN